jgi:hypothetical protein
MTLEHNDPTYWRHAYRDHATRREALYDALYELVHELEDWDYSAQRDEAGGYGPETALGMAREVLNNETDNGGGPSVCRGCGGRGVRHNREEEGDYGE